MIETLFTIQNALLENPLLDDLIKGANGARKGRVRNPRAVKFCICGVYKGYLKDEAPF